MVDGSREGHLTPEDAALVSFDLRYARVVRVHETTCHGETRADLREVELATNEPPSEYPYYVDPSQWRRKKFPR